MEFQWLGILFVMTGSICSGIWYRIRLIGQMENLKECKRAMSILRGEIEYGRTPLPEACYEVEKRVGGVCRTFFKEVRESLDEGASSVEAIWCEKTVMLFSSLQMKAQERQEWMRLGNTLGYLDVTLQIRTIDLYLQRLQTSIDQAEQDCQKRMRIYPLLGTFGGAVICLIFV